MNFIFDYHDVSLPEDILKYRALGEFERERALITAYLKRGCNELLRAHLLAEYHISFALAHEYPLSRRDALTLLRAKIDDFDDMKLQKLIDDGYVDWQCFEGEKRFRKNIYSNLVCSDSPYTQRDADELAQRKMLDDTISEMKQAGQVGYRFKIRSWLKITAEAREDEKNRVQLPLIKPTDTISNITLLDTSEKLSDIAREDAPQRTVLFESASREFWIEYTFDSIARYTRLVDKAAVRGTYDFCLDEQPPHILFTRYLRSLAKEIVGDEKNPLVKARLIYKFITEHVRYSFMRPYFTVDNLSEYAALNRKGDCGVQALLFITLCRICGVPARWESGRFAPIDHTGMHDWARFYIEPYGWLWADCSFGGSALRAQSKLRHDFYFGNIDPFRLVFADEFQTPFEQPKEFLRSDPCDNQCGEAESNLRGFSQDDFDYGCDIISCEKLEF